MAAEFVHLHNHTEYSILDGAVCISGKKTELFNVIAKEHNMRALAITDHGNMYGAIPFYSGCVAAGIKPIIGCEVYVAKKSRFDKDKDSRNYNHLILLAKDSEGYRNLMHMVSLGFTDGFYYKPRVDKELIQKYSKGLICSSACLAGEVAEYLSAGNKEEAKKTAGFYRDIFGKDYYLEIMDNGLEEQKRIIAPLMELSKETGISLVATNDCHYLRKEDAKYHDVLLCINTNKQIDDPDRMRYGSDLFYYRSAEEMINLFSYVPEATKNTLEIAEKVNLQINTHGDNLLPKYEVPEGFTPETYLEKLCKEGLVRRYGSMKKEALDRLNYELSVINKMGFPSYFLIVWDFIKYSKDHGIPVGPGRGSGAGSIVAYTLGITDICPLKYDLMFERFLNPDRISMPDLDIDFADFGREKVIQYVRDKYGHNNCAQIITFGSLQSKVVIKDVARAMGFTPAESQKIANFVPAGSSVPEAVVKSPDLQKAMKDDPKVTELIKISGKLEGLKRQTGIHAAGLVVAPSDIRDYSPLAVGKDAVVTTQYDGKVLPDLGLLKVDFLGLKTLSIIDEALKYIKEKDPNFDLDKISLTDAKTFELLQAAKTFGVFQFESAGIKDLVRRLKPTSLEDIIAMNALYRPGPIEGGMLDIFINCKHGRTEVKYDLPQQEPILKNTYGVILYQEQVMQLAVAIGGFTAGQADTLRKAMGKKLVDKMAEYKEKFLKGAKAQNIDVKIAEEIYDKMAKFAGYGFNKSHSAAYGYVAYRTAYLKAHYPLEFMTACMNSELGSSKKAGEANKIVEYIDDVKDYGIKTLAPDIQKSKPRFSVEGANIRYGFLGIKNVGEAAAENIYNTRKKCGQFESYDDFLLKVDLSVVNKKAIECLAKAGAFDCFGKDKLKIRAEILNSIDSKVSEAVKEKKDLNSDQGFLFETSDIKTTKPSAGISNNVVAIDENQSLEYEKEVLDFYLSGHPLEKYKRDFVSYSMYQLDKVPVPPENTNLRNAKTVWIAGMVTGVKKLKTKETNKDFISFKVEDMYGSLECVVFSKTYEDLKEDRNLIYDKSVVVLKGKLLNNKTFAKLAVENIYSVDTAKKKFPPFLGTLHIQVSQIALDDELSDKIINVISKYPGKSKVYIDIRDYKSGGYTIETEYSVKYSDECINELSSLLGKESVILQHGE